jgi:hypothetical protein
LGLPSRKSSSFEFKCFLITRKVSHWIPVMILKSPILLSQSFFVHYVEYVNNDNHQLWIPSRSRQAVLDSSQPLRNLRLLYRPLSLEFVVPERILMASQGSFYHSRLFLSYCSWIWPMMQSTSPIVFNDK